MIFLVFTTFFTIKSGSLLFHSEYKGSAWGVVRRSSGPSLQLAEHGERGKGAGDEEDLGVLHLGLAGQHCPWQPHNYLCHHCCQHHCHQMHHQWLIIINMGEEIYVIRYIPRLQQMVWASFQLERGDNRPNLLLISTLLQHLIACTITAN